MESEIKELKCATHKLIDAVKEAKAERDEYLKIAAVSKDEAECLRSNVKRLQDELTASEKSFQMLTFAVAAKERLMKARMLILHANIIAEDNDDHLSGTFNRWEASKDAELGAAPNRACRLLEHYAKLLRHNLAPEWV